MAVGTGSGATGSFFGIKWGADPYFIETEIDPDGGEEYTVMGTTELINVPYAFFAKRSCSVLGTSANIYNELNQVVPINADVTFSNTGIATGEILHAPGSQIIVLGAPRVYEVTFNISGVESYQADVQLNWNKTNSRP